MLHHYRKLLLLEVLHTYYNNGYSEDFAFSPTKDTQSLMEEYGLIFRNSDTGFHLFYRAEKPGADVEPTHPIGDMPEGEILRFAMRLNNLKFLNFTEMGPGFTSLKNAVVLFNTNGGTLNKPGSLPESIEMPAFTILPLRAQELTYRFTVPGNPGTCQLVIKDARGKTVRSVTVEKALDDTYTANLDLSRVRPGRYVFSRLHPTTGLVSPSEELYLDTRLQNQGPFGIVELVNESDADGLLWEQIQEFNKTGSNNADLDYSISFDHKTEIWKYTVVFKQTAYNNIPSRYGIRDALTTVLTDDRYNTGNPADEFFFSDPPTATTFDGYPALVFSSEDGSNAPKAIPWYEEAKHDLVLAELNNGGNITKRLIRKLANPDPGYPLTEIIVYI